MPAFLKITFLFLFGLNFSILPITFLFFVGGKIYSLVCITAIINAILFVHIFYSCVQFYLSYPHAPLLRTPLLLSVVEKKYSTSASPFGNSAIRSRLHTSNNQRGIGAVSVAC